MYLTALVSFSILILVVVLVFSPVVFANGDHAHGDEQDGDAQTSQGARWPVAVGGVVLALLVAVVGYKFVVK